MKKTKLIVLCIAVLLLGCKTTKVVPVVGNFAEENQPKTTKQIPLNFNETQTACIIDSLMENAIDSCKIPGGVVCLTADTGIVFLKAYGNRQVLPDTLPMTTNTIFDLASLTKSVATTSAIMALVADSLVNLNAPISTYLSDHTTPREGVEPTHNLDSIKVVHLMTHTSGLPSYLNANRLAKALGEGNRHALIDTICTCPQKYKPGTDMIYSCLNFIMLQHIVETVTGMRFDLYCKEHVFKPLGMFNTTFFPLGKEAQEEKLNAEIPALRSQTILSGPVAPTEIIPNPDGVSSKEGTEGGLLLHKAVHDPLARVMNAGISGNAGCFAPAEDLARLAQFLLINQQDSLVKVFTTVPDSLEYAFRTPGWAVPKQGMTYLGSHPIPGTYGHTGYTGTSIAIVPAKKIALIILTNRAHPHDGGGVGRLRREITDVILEEISTQTH